MSRSSKQPLPSPPSSLSGMPTPSGSAPVSPSLLALSTSKLIPSTSMSSSGTDSSMEIVRKMQEQQSETKRELSDLKFQIGDLVSLMQSIVSDRTSTNLTSSTASSEPKQVDSVPVQAKPISLSSTLIQRDRVKDQVFESSKKLFGVSDSQLNTIDAMNSRQSAINQTFDFNESTIQLDESKLSDNVSNNPNNFAFIQQLLPTATASQPTLTELLQSGLKATAANNDRTKIKDVHKLLELLTEQAKSIIKSSEQSHDSTSNATSDYLIYTLNLMKLLFDFGLQATLEYHFALMKKVQANECRLTGEHPMLYIEIASKYKRLQTSNVLQSSLMFTSNTNSNSNSKSSNGKSNGRTPKFTGKPCEYHTKLLGKPANHSSDDCRVAKAK
jgi:hypothetical protein